MKVRVKAYAPSGASLGILPTPVSISASLVLGDTGAMSLEYGKAAPQATLLDSPCELALEVSQDNGATWVEPDDARYVYLRRKGDTVKRPSHLTAEAAAYSWRLATAKVLPSGLLDANGKRPFPTSTPGMILATLIQEAQARGALTGMAKDFTTTLDSNGVAWANTLTIDYAPGMDYLAIVRNLFDQGLIDFRFRGRTLQVFNADTAMARRLDAANPVVDLRYGRDLTEAPYQGTWEALANFAYVQGDLGTSLERTNGSAYAPWGRQETFIAQGGITDPGTMTALADASLSDTAEERMERTYGLSLDAARWLPLTDYALGDYVAVGDTSLPLNHLAAYRVRQVTLKVNASGMLDGNVVLNDRFVEQEIRTSRRVTGILGGSTITGGSGASPVPPSAPPTLDTLAPGATTGLASSSVAYLDTVGAPHAQVTLSWSKVTLNSNGTACDDLDHYAVFRRTNTGGTIWTPAEADIADVAGTVSWSHSPYDTGTSWVFKVRAVDKSGNVGAFSADLVVTMATDATPPPVPSTPTVTVRLGVVSVSWDGLDNLGNAMPLDLGSVELHRSLVSGFTPDATTLAARVGSKGMVVFSGQTYGTVWYYRLKAIDTSRNASGPSIQVSATTTPLVATDLVGTPIPGSALVADSITATQLAANSVTADAIIAGAVSAIALTADAIDGKTITGSTIRTAAAGARFEVDTYGARLYDATGNLEVNLPTDPDQAAYFSGNILATGLTIQDLLSLQGVNNEFAAQSVTTLQSGVMPPTTAPAVSLGFPEVVMNGNADAVNSYVGLWVPPSGGGFSRGWQHYNPYDPVDYGLHFGIEHFDAAGNLLTTTDLTGAWGDNVIGACEDATTWTLLTKPSWMAPTQYHMVGIAKPGPSGGGSSTDVTLPAGSHKPTIFNDASWLYLAYMTATQLIIERRAKDSFSVLGTYAGPNGGLARDLTAGMGLGNFDYGSARFVLTDDVVGAYGYVWTYSGSTLARAAGDDWILPNNAVPYGFTWDGVRFWVGPRDRPDALVEMSEINWTAVGTAYWYASYTWYHTTNLWQSKVSPVAKFSMAKRAWITMSTPPFPLITAPGVPPDSVMTYLSNSGLGGPPIGTQYHPAGTPPTAAKRTYVYGASPYSFTGANPPLNGSFPALVAGLLKAAALAGDGAGPAWSLSGDGTIHAYKTFQTGYFNTATLPASTGAAAGSVVFPHGAMTAAPTVVMTAGSSRITCSCSGITANGFNWSINNWSPGGAGATFVDWIAIAP